MIPIPSLMKFLISKQLLCQWRTQGHKWVTRFLSDRLVVNYQSYAVIIRAIWSSYRRRQDCARLIFFFGLTRLRLIWQSRGLNSDSTQIPNLLTWLNSDSTQNPNLLTWLNSDSTHLSQSWVKSDSRLITFYLIWEKVVDRGGGGVRSNVAVCSGWFFLCKVTDNCKTFSLRKSVTQLWLKQYPVDSTLTQMTISVIRLWLDSYPGFSRPTRLWPDSFESESSQIWLTTHESSTTLVGGWYRRRRRWRYIRGQSCVKS